MVARINGTSQPGGGFAHFYDWSQVHDWASAYVYTAFRTGWMLGDGQGSFRPLDHISRAEAATTINRMLGRIDSWAALEEISLRNPYAVQEFPDVLEPGWYFPSVLAAANDHRLGRDTGGSIDWKEILPGSNA